MTNKLIALDADGVTLDYNTAYGRLWELAFRTRLTDVHPQAYHARDRWGLPNLLGEELEYFRTFFNEQFWSTVPAMPGAIDACHALVEGGYTLVCVSALPTAYGPARLANLKTLGFPIGDVYATPTESLARGPKARTLIELSPAAFVDDFLPYFHGVPDTIHRALIHRNLQSSPNVGSKFLPLADSLHADLQGFAQWWLARPEAT